MKVLERSKTSKVTKDAVSEGRKHVFSMNKSSSPSCPRSFTGGKVAIKVELRSRKPEEKGENPVETAAGSLQNSRKLLSAVKFGSSGPMKLLERAMTLRLSRLVISSGKLPERLLLFIRISSADLKLDL